MAGRKYIRVNTTGDPQQFDSVQTSSGVSSAGEIVALNEYGHIDQSMIPGVPLSIYTATEAIGAGAFINIWDSSGGKVRNANAASGLRAHGFAPGAISMGATGMIITGEEDNASLSGLTIGAEYVLGTTAGQVMQATSGNIATLVSGYYLQHLGVARSSSELVVHFGDVTIM